IFVMFLALFLATTASASGGYTIDGKLFGMVVQNGIDLDGDGSAGRSGMLRARDSVFTYVDVNLDVTTFFMQGSCQPGEVELFATGQVAFSTLNGKHVIFAEIDPTVPVCYGLGAPEDVALVLVGGRGAFDG